MTIKRIKTLDIIKLKRIIDNQGHNSPVERIQVMAKGASKPGKNVKKPKKVKLDK